MLPIVPQPTPPSDTLKSGSLLHEKKGDTMMALHQQNDRQRFFPLAPDFITVARRDTYRWHSGWPDVTRLQEANGAFHRRAWGRDYAYTPDIGSQFFAQEAFERKRAEDILFTQLLPQDSPVAEMTPRYRLPAVAWLHRRH